MTDTSTPIISTSFVGVPPGLASPPQDPTPHSSGNPPHQQSPQPPAKNTGVNLQTLFESLSLSDLEKVANFAAEKVANLKREEEKLRLEEIRRREAIEVDEITRLAARLIELLKNRRSEADVPELQEIYDIIGRNRYSVQSNFFMPPTSSASSYRDRSSRFGGTNSMKEMQNDLHAGVARRR